MEHLPLHGKNILVTRGKEQAKEFSDKLKQAGACPLEIPLIAVSAVADKEKIDQHLRDLSRYKWIVFTSANGVRFFFSLMQEAKPLPNIAAVGKKTAAALEKRGVHPDLVPGEFVAEGLAKAMQPLLQPRDRILLVKGNLARPTLKEELLRLGADVDDLVVYETTINENGKEQLIDLLKKKAIDVITFTSSSTVHSLLRLLEGTDLLPLVQRCVIACIGPITKQTAEQAGLSVHICPAQYTIDDMIKEMEHFFAKQR